MLLIYLAIMRTTYFMLVYLYQNPSFYDCVRPYNKICTQITQSYVSSLTYWGIFIHRYLVIRFCLWQSLHVSPINMLVNLRHNPAYYSCVSLSKGKMYSSKITHAHAYPWLIHWAKISRANRQKGSCIHSITQRKAPIHLASWIHHDNLYSDVHYQL